MNDPNDAFGPRGAPPTATPHNDPDAVGNVGWIDMPPAARATACLAALMAHWPIETPTMKWDRRRGIVYVSRSSVRDPAFPPSARRQVVSREVLRLQDALDKIRAGFGLPREIEVRKLVSGRR